MNNTKEVKIRAQVPGGESFTWAMEIAVVLDEENETTWGFVEKGDAIEYVTLMGGRVVDLPVLGATEASTLLGRIQART